MPTLRLEVVKVAVDVVPAGVSVPVPMLAPLSKKVTVPLGLATAVLPGEGTLTVAVNVTDPPEADGFCDELTVVVVLAWFTVCVIAAEVLALKLVLLLLRS